MRFQTSLPAAIMGLALVATGCSDQTIAGADAPDAVAMQAPAGASFQNQNANTGQATFGNLIAALNNITANINNLQVLSDLIDAGDINVQDVNVALVNIDDVRVNVNALNNALNRNNVDIDALQNFLNNVDITITDVLTNVLTNADILVTDVIAVDVNLLSGDIVVFHR
ncbi:MAG: hypothetical protein KY467_08145 [Gemmatimonadetes bacterium]|nr:hypothetical protein [Gemmatimonadota bacterium]